MNMKSFLSFSFVNHTFVNLNYFKLKGFVRDELFIFGSLFFVSFRFFRFVFRAEPRAIFCVHCEQKKHLQSLCFAVRCNPYRYQINQK